MMHPALSLLLVAIPVASWSLDGDALVHWHGRYALAPGGHDALCVDRLSVHLYAKYRQQKHNILSISESGAGEVFLITET